MNTKSAFDVRSYWKNVPKTVINDISNEEFIQHQNEIYQWAVFNMVVGARSTVTFMLDHGGFIDFRKEATAYRSLDTGCYKGVPIGYTVKYQLHLYAPIMLDLIGKHMFGPEFDIQIPLRGVHWPVNTRLCLSEWHGYKRIAQYFNRWCRKFTNDVHITPNDYFYCGQIDKTAVDEGLLPNSREAEIFTTLLMRYHFKTNLESTDYTFPKLLFTVGGGEMISFLPKDVGGPFQQYRYYPVDEQEMAETNNVYLCLDQLLLHSPFPRPSRHQSVRNPKLKFKSENGVLYAKLPFSDEWKLFADVCLEYMAIDLPDGLPSKLVIQ